MKPVRFRTVTTTLTVLVSDVYVLLDKIFNLGISKENLFLIVLFIVAPGITAIGLVLSKDYEETEENNDSLFSGLLVLFTVLFFLIVVMF